MSSRNDTGSELRERPIGEVARDLTKDLSLLVRQEIELAKAEMGQKGRTAAPGIGMLGDLQPAVEVVVLVRVEERLVHEEQEGETEGEGGGEDRRPPGDAGRHRPCSSFRVRRICPAW